MMEMHPALRRAIIAARSAPAQYKPARMQPMAVDIEARRTVPRSFGMDRVRKIVAACANITIEEMDSSRRDTSIKEAREIAAYLCRTNLKKTHAEIAAVFANRDRTTILYAIQKTAARIAADPEFAARVEAIREIIAS